MSYRGVIEEQKPKPCELCGTYKETRPYGSKGENVCYPCGMKDVAAAKRGMDRLLSGEGHA